MKYLSFLLVFAVPIYLYRLSSIPPAVYVDEATVAYNAYSLLSTGKDEYGKSFPLLFRLFGAYIPPFFVYLSWPFIYVLGLFPATLRLISLISGLVSIVIFFLTVGLFTRQKSLQFWGALIYSILPWTVFNSRIGYEVMLAATLFNLGIFFLLKTFSRPRFLSYGLFFISLSAYTAHTQKFLAPLWLISYLVLFKKLYLKTILFLLILQAPNILIITTPAFWYKASGVAGQAPIQLFNKFISQYLTYLSPKTLFFNPPDIDLQHQIPQIGLFFWWLIFPLIFGLKQLLSSLSPPKYRFLSTWIILSIVPASLSGDFISVQRALPLLFPLSLVIALGFKKIKPLFLFFLSLYSFILLFRSYFIFFPRENALGWNYGYKQLSEFIQTHPNAKLMIDNTRNPRNYILLLYYLKYSPSLYHQEVGDYTAKNYYQNPPVSLKYQFGNYQFRPLDWQTDPCRFDYLVGDELSFSPQQIKDYHLRLHQTFTTAINQIALLVYSTPKLFSECLDKQIINQ